MNPCRDYLLALPDELIDSPIMVSQSTHTVESQRQIGRFGTVIAVGPGRRDKRGVIHSPTVKPGDRIVWGEFEFPEYRANGKKYAILQEADICGVLEP
jgi:chaperonin GroES